MFNRYSVVIEQRHDKIFEYPPALLKIEVCLTADSAKGAIDEVFKSITLNEKDSYQVVAVEDTGSAYYNNIINAKRCLYEE